MPRKARTYALSPAELRFDFADWLYRNWVVVYDGGQEWEVTCPACGLEKMAVHVGRKAFHCWRCPFAGWSPTVFISVCLGISMEAAAEAVAAYALGRTMGPVDPLVAERRGRTSASVPQAPTTPGMVWYLTDHTARYAQSRGIPWEHAEAYRLGTCVDDGSQTRANWILRGRLMFPIWSPSGRFVFWTGRSTDPASEAKLVNLPLACKTVGHPPTCTCFHEKWGLPQVAGVAGKEEVLLGLHLVRRGEPVYVVEGPVDAAVCGPGFVATLGATLSPAQAVLLAASGASEAFVVFDGDDPGRKGARGYTRNDGTHVPGAGELLGGMMPTRVASLPEDADPGALGRAGTLAWVERTAPPPGGVLALAPPRPESSERTRLPKPFIDKLA